MKRAVPTGRFTIEKRDGRLYFFPQGPLGEKGVFFVAEKKGAQFLLHDGGSIMEASIGDAMEAVDVVRELRFAAKSAGFNFKDGRVFVKVSDSGLEQAVRRLERLASEVYHKSTVGLGG